LCILFMTYEIFKFTKNYLEQYLDSLILTFDNMSAVWQMSLDEANVVFANMQKQWTISFVAIDDSVGIIWFISLLIEQKFQKWWACAAHLEDVVVRKWWEWLGIWSQLIEKLLEELDKYNCYKIILDCEENLTWYYEQFWFESDGIFMRKYL